MARYFVFGNFWLFVALALFLGCSFARSGPDMVSFTQWGGWLYTSTYQALEILCLIAALVCFILATATRKTRDRIET